MFTHSLGLDLILLRMILFVVARVHLDGEGRSNVVVSGDHIG